MNYELKLLKSNYFLLFHILIFIKYSLVFIHLNLEYDCNLF